MEVRVRDLRNRTAMILAALETGERVTLLRGDEPVADIVPHVRRTRWLPGGWLKEQLVDRQADPQLASQLDAAVGQTIDELGLRV
jgi:antitoxin (DNA-binding transcriptional repressor) of toxin-antitoxin stability system